MLVDILLQLQKKKKKMKKTLEKKQRTYDLFGYPFVVGWSLARLLFELTLTHSNSTEMQPNLLANQNS